MILKEITDYGYKHLSVDDINDLKSFIGSTVTRSENIAEIDGGTLWIMPDDNECHDCFLILE